MSYSFTLKVKDGVVTPEISPGMEKYIPNGTFYINGHEDERCISLHASRTREDGTIAAQINSGTCTPNQA